MEYVYKNKPIEIDGNAKQRRMELVDRKIESQNKKILEAKELNKYECVFILRKSEPAFNELKEVYENAGYSVKPDYTVLKSGEIHKMYW
ncbi:MAG: hypothetical protein E7273_13120 [Pseudobutyrivibrio ruminis]|nr:hypothetical protein [Pseudobutyrivibrio ruminis]